MKRKIIGLDWIISTHLPFLKRFGLYESIIRKYYEDWKTAQPSATENDYLWHIFQTLISSIAEKANSQEQFYELSHATYSKMWEFLIHIEKRNGNHVKLLMHENEIRLWKLTTPFKSEVIIISGHCCKFCDDLNQIKISFEEALTNKYLASDNCTREWGCNCCYSLVSVKDENGDLIIFEK